MMQRRILTISHSKKWVLLMLIILLITGISNTLFAQTYQYSSGYHVNTDVTGGVFYDGGGPSSPYGATDNYTVTFIAPAGYNLIFNFTSFLIVGNGVLSIYNGLSADPAALIGDFSYTNPIGDDLWSQINQRRSSPFILSSGRALTFVFNANNTTNGGADVGWIADIDIFPSSYSQNKINEISGQTLIYEGYFFDDGGFEDRYSTTDYTTTFQAPTDHILKIEFMFYDITGANDKLDVYDDNSTAGGGATRLARLQGNSDPVTYYSTGEYLTIDWTAKQTSPTIRGWVAKIEAVSVSCGTYDMTTTTTNTDCGLFFDSGGSAGDFSGSDNLTHTFCSNNGLPLTFNFYDYAMGSSELLVYDGSSVAATQLVFNTANYFDASDMNDKYITSSGSCITFHFNGANPKDRGWASKIVTQPHVSNNDICNATKLNVNAARQMENYNNIYATQSMSEPGCVGGSSGDFLKDVWFYIITPNDGLFNIDIEASSFRNMGAALYSGSCAGALTEEHCSVADNISFTQADVTTPTPGDTLFVRIWGQSGEAGTFNIGSYAPVSTSCADAGYYEVTKESTLSYVEFPGLGSALPTSCGSYSQWTDGVAWFKFTVPESQELTFLTQRGSADNINLVVYSGSCSTPTEAFCYNNAETANYIYDASSHTAGDTLWIAYWGDNNNWWTNTSYQFSIFDPEPESNNPCDAVLFNVSGEENFIYYDNTGADDSGVDPGAGCSYTAGDKDMWFKFVAPEDGEATVKTTGGSLTDIGLAVFSGTCGSLSPIQCATSNGLGEITEDLTGLTPGDSVFVKVWGNSGNSGIYGLSISVENPDGPCDANVLSVQEYSASGNYNFQGYSTNSNTPSGIAVPPCGSPTVNDIDIWFNAVVPASGQIGFLTQNESLPNLGMALYNGNNCASPNYLTCTYDIGDLNIELTGQTPGDTIRVRIWSDFTLTGYFEIAAYDAGATLSIVGLEANYCYSETLVNDAIAGSPLGGSYSSLSGAVFTDNGDGTATLHIGNDSTQWGDHSITYTVGGSSVTENFRVNPSYVPNINPDTLIICDGDTPTAITASAEAASVFNWYDDAALTNLIHTGVSYTPIDNTWNDPTYVETHYFYVTQDIEGCTSADSVAVYLIYKIPETGPGYHISNTWGQ